MYLSRQKLKAALVIAPKADIRYYLNGVLIERTPNGDLHYVSTDGHRLFAGVQYADWRTDKDKPGLLTLIIPRDTVDQAVKGRASIDQIELTHVSGREWKLGNVLFTPIEGTFPDWRRVLPSLEGREERHAMFNWAYINDAEKALSLWHDTKAAHGYLRQYGEDCALMTGKDASAFVVIMPLRHNGYESPLTPFKPASTTDSRPDFDALQGDYAQYLLNIPDDESLCDCMLSFEDWLQMDQPVGPVVFLPDVPELTEQL